MKICYLSLGFMPAIKLGGSIRSAYRLTKALVQRGHEVTVCCTNLAGRKEKLFPETRRVSMDGVNVIYFSTHRLFPLGRNSFGLFVCPELIGFCRAKLPEYDLVHIDGYRDFPALIASYFCRRYGIPYLLQARGSMQPAYSSVAAKHVYDLLLGKRILKNCALFIASSASEEAEYHGLIPVGKQISRIANGIDTDEFARLPERGAFRHRWGIREPILVSYLGRIHRLKGIEYLVQAFAMARCQRESRLAIIGPDEGYRSFLESLVQRLGLTESVSFVGALEGEEKLQAYVDSDVLVYAGKSESFGMVAVEATICGVPVVTAKGTGCSEVLANLGTDFPVEYGDTRQLADTLDYILANREVLAARIRAAGEKVRNQLSWANIARRYEDAYLSVIKQRVEDKRAREENAVAVAHD